MKQPTRSIDVLFVSEHALWPLDQGFCVHGYHMAGALRDLGVRVGIASQAPLPDSAPAPMRNMTLTWPDRRDHHLRQLLRAWRGPGYAVRRRLASYQGRNLSCFAGVIPLVKRTRPHTVIALGQHGPLMLRALRDLNTRRVWYAADEPVFFQLSCMRREPLSQAASRLTKVALYAGLETFFVRDLDGAIGVSPLDSRLLKLLAGARSVVTIRNGVDLDHFSPSQPPTPPIPRSLVFWGRMDFEPNIDAVSWFAHNVWPHLRACRPDATWQIVGKHPHPQVQRLAHVAGIEVVGEVADIRPLARSAAVAILPVRCGGGIKNKLLEAAAMARPIVASPRAIRGLCFDTDRPPLLACATSGQWVEAIRRLWSEPQLAASLGESARAWVSQHHTWTNAAHLLQKWIEGLPGPVTARISRSTTTAMSKASHRPLRRAA